MTYTLYDGTIVVLQGILKTLTHILQVAEKQPNANDLLKARLHETMYPLPDQIRIVTQYTETLLARLTSRTPIAFPKDDLTSFPAFQTRISTVLTALQEADRDVVNANAEKVEKTQMGPDLWVEMGNAMYAHKVVLPNVYFHLGMAYAILRMEGVEIGKRDYYEGFFPSGGGK